MSAVGTKISQNHFQHANWIDAGTIRSYYGHVVTRPHLRWQVGRRLCRYVTVYFGNNLFSKGFLIFLNLHCMLLPRYTTAASPAQKKWGVRTIFLCWWTIKVTIFIHGIPSIYKKTFQRIFANLRRGLNISRGSGTTYSPVETPLLNII